MLGSRMGCKCHPTIIRYRVGHSATMRALTGPGTSRTAINQ
jgi:hypothetical protein